MDEKATSKQFGGDTERDDGQTNVAKIRDILFGGQMRDYDQRFAGIENRLAAEYRRLADTIQARFDQLDGFMRKELALLGERLSIERKERLQKFDEQSSEMHEMRKNMEDKIADVEDVSAEAAQHLRSRLHEQSSEILQLLQRAQDELTTSLRDESRRLQDAKVAREDLAELLTEMALRLKRDIDLPDRD